MIQILADRLVVALILLLPLELVLQPLDPSLVLFYHFLDFLLLGFFASEEMVYFLSLLLDRCMRFLKLDL